MRATAWRWHLPHDWGVQVTALAPFAAGLAVALADGRIVVTGGQHDGWQIDTGLGCMTALCAQDGALLVTNGAERLAPDDWQRDLMQRGASGSRAGMAVRGGGGCTGRGDIRGLAAPSDPAGWHRSVRRYARLSGPYRCRDRRFLAGHVRAPRSQLVEFVLREPAYRNRIMAEVPREFWVAPRLRAGRSFHESLQGGGVKQLGMLKPWAPTMSAGYCVRLDRGFQPRTSLQSRADGVTHGVTAAVAHDGQLVIAARGDGVVVTLPLTPEEDR